MKLSEKQHDIIWLMQNGWELGFTGFGGAWVQKNGLGKGGELKRVANVTVIKLIENGFVKPTNYISFDFFFPIRTYVLTKLGMNPVAK